MLKRGRIYKIKGIGSNFEAIIGKTDKVLPVPATYVINRSGKISFVYFDKDFKKHESVAAIIAAL